LLINIGKTASKYIDGKNKVKYYAQELNLNTYNLTRMNLVMRGVDVYNIVTRNGNTLEDDWPYFEENDPVGTYKPLYVDAVVSNPPYSQDWNPADKEADPRYAGYGLAPKSKADYAFLLHDLYHIKPDGIMTIVLPHGVLFRGGEEGEIRRNLIEKNNIDTIIGLPANIFYGTGIPTIIMVLKQKRKNTDVLIIEASKWFVKEGKNNKLRASDIKRIVDAVKERKNIDKFSRVVSRDEIRENDYNLNIPRYVDSSVASESWDIYASMFGGLPVAEIDNLNEYCKAFPTLRSRLFENTSSEYCTLAVSDIKKAIKEHADVKKFENEFQACFAGFDKYMYDELILKTESLNISKTEEILADNIFSRLTYVPLVDKYEAYQILDDEWSKIAVDLEIIQTEGFGATKVVDPNMVVKKKGGKDREVQDGWKGRVIPFELVQSRLLSADVEKLRIAESRIAEIASEYEELIDSLSEEDREKLLNDDNTQFVAKEVKNAAKEVLNDISTPKTKVLEEYLKLSKLSDKQVFVKEHVEIDWSAMPAAKNGTFAKSEINKYISLLKSKFTYSEGTYEYIVTRTDSLMTEEKELKKTVREQYDKLHLKTKHTIENLTDEQVICLLKEKWITPLIENIMRLPVSSVNELVAQVESIAKKYETTFADIETQISETENVLSAMIDELEGNEFDMLGLAEFKKLLGGSAK
jgi:type I restriction enzyme M protein